ncbi:TonB-dependent receptor [uncultured Bacteroides sp.]|uniref:TonB-dependent receptor n=1 Tax=uncultured Bacteroides sp. TaxID=162156 RepID=UPI002AA69A01|nr:TonB-dependent receptor [uncultured Bacteroides sp.]
MKNLIKLVACGLLLSTEAGAQTIYDAAKFSGSDLNGTARFVGMGGAMGALGGDISTIGTNPAGIGLYRSNDLMTSFGINYTTSESNFNGSKMNSDKLRGSFDNIGFVYSSKIGNQTALKYVNFGFNYHKAKSFNRDFAMQGNLNGTSQTDQMANMANAPHQGVGLSENEMGLGELANNGSYASWLSILGWNSFLIRPNLDPKHSGEYVGFQANDPSGSYSSIERGGIDVYDFNVSFNINNRVYLGFTLGAYDLNYTKNTLYSEFFNSSINPLDDKGNEIPYFKDNNNYSYSLENFMRTTGTGVDFKAGVIFRPFEDSPLRIGAAIHTPTFYNLTMYNSAILTSDADVKNGYIIPVNPLSIDTYKEIKGDVATEYQIRTPWKYNLSLGYTIGSNVALGAEYEYKDYSTAKLSYYDGSSMTYENSMMKDMLKGVSTLRLGAEVKLVPEFAIRAGYNHIGAGYKDGAYKSLPLNSVRTDTDYSNEKSINNYTLGLGYRSGSFYADIAYQYSAYKEDFYAFDIAELNKTIVNNDKQQVLLTLGFRF